MEVIKLSSSMGNSVQDTLVYILTLQHKLKIVFFMAQMEKHSALYFVLRLVDMEYC